MNPLNPQLKELLKIAQRVEQSRELSYEASSAFTRRVLARLTADSIASQISLLELMVKRCAAFAALIGVLILAIQFAVPKPSLGVLKNISTPGVALFRIVLR